MLPLAERLKRPNLFTRAYGAKKLVTTPIFTLYVLPRQERSIKASSAFKRTLPMVGFVASKKTSKSACLRNKMKRRLREAYRNMTRLAPDMAQQAPPLQKWYAVVFVIKENALTAKWTDIRITMENAFMEAARRHG